MRVRKIKTASGKYALQVVSKIGSKLKVHKHIGSYCSESEREILYSKARNYIETKSGQVGLFEGSTKFDFSEIAILESKPLFAYKFLGKIYSRLGFDEYNDEVLKDLIAARIFLYFDVFKGNTFEGHTFLVTIEKVIRLLNNPKIVVIADAGMLSKINIDDLDKRNIGFIVGARISNLSATLIDKISKRLSDDSIFALSC